MEPVSPQLYYLMYFNYFYPQAPHGACQSYFSSALKIYLISILRLRMEPVKMQAFLKNLCEYFYPQAPHGACPGQANTNSTAAVFLSSGSAWSLSIKQKVDLNAFDISILRLRMEPVRNQDDKALRNSVFLSSGSAWSLSIPLSATHATLNNFYPQAPHGACRPKIIRTNKDNEFLSSGSAWSLSAKNTKNMSYSHSVFLQHYQ